MLSSKRQISAEFVELRCSQCAGGVYRLTRPQSEQTEKWRESVVIQCNPTVWDCACHLCGHQTAFMRPGPFVVYKGKEFVLFDSVEEKVQALRALLRSVSR